MWNFRFVNTPSENDGEDWIGLKEVHYTDGKPAFYTEPCLGSENAEGIVWLTEKWAEAASQPVLHENDFTNDLPTAK